MTTQNSFYVLFSTMKNQNSLKKWLNSGLGQRKHKVRLQCLAVPESKELFKDYWEQKDKGTNVKGLPLSRFEAIWESNSIMMGKGYNILRLFFNSTSSQ